MDDAAPQFNNRPAGEAGISEIPPRHTNTILFREKPLETLHVFDDSKRKAEETKRHRTRRGADRNQKITPGSLAHSLALAPDG